MNELIFLAIFIAIGAACIIFGYLASRSIKTTTDFFLAGRNLGLAPVTFTLIATHLGGGMLLGTSAEAYSIGLFGILYTLGVSLGFLLLGSGFASTIQSLNVETTAQLFETRYQSPSLKKVASLLSIATLGGILIAQVVASRSVMLGIGVTNPFILLSFWAFIILYTMLGGMHALVVIDSVQVLFIIATFGSIFLYAIFNAPASLMQVLSSQETFANMQLSWTSLSRIIIIPALFSLIEQDLAQKFFAARTKKIAALAAICSSAFMLIFSFIPVYFGMQAKLLGISVAGNPLMLAVEYFSGHTAMILAMCGVIAAITSTADSLLCAISSNLSQDFDFSSLGIANKLTISRIITFLLGTGAVVASYIVPQNVIGLLINSYEISVCCLLVPLVVCYFKKEVHQEAAVLSVIGGAAGLLYFYFYPTTLPQEITTLFISGACYYLGTLIAHSNKK